MIENREVIYACNSEAQIGSIIVLIDRGVNLHITLGGICSQQSLDWKASLMSAAITTEEFAGVQIGDWWNSCLIRLVIWSLRCTMLAIYAYRKEAMFE